MADLLHARAEMRGEAVEVVAHRFRRREEGIVGKDERAGAVAVERLDGARARCVGGKSRVAHQTDDRLRLIEREGEPRELEAARRRWQAGCNRGDAPGGV